MFIYLDHTQSTIIIFIEDGFDTGRFSRTAVPEQKDIVGRTAFHKISGIVHELFLLKLISHQIIQMHMLRTGDGRNLHLFLRMVHDAERFVKPEGPHAESLIKLGHNAEKGLIILCLGQMFCQLADPVPDPFIEYLAVFIHIGIILQNLRHADSEMPIQTGKVKGKQFPEYPKILHGQLVDAALHRPHHFTGRGKCIFPVGNHKCQVRMPEIPLQPIMSGQLHKGIHTFII